VAKRGERKKRSEVKAEPKPAPPSTEWLDEHGIKNPNQRRYLVAFSVTGNPSRAELASQVSRKSHYKWLAGEGPEADAYREAVEDAKQRACEYLEGVAWDWATEGIMVPKWHNGKRVGWDREKSMTLLIFMMKGAMPDKYRDNVSVKGDVAGKLTLEMVAAAAMKPEPPPAPSALATDSAKSA